MVKSYYDSSTCILLPPIITGITMGVNIVAYNKTHLTDYKTGIIFETAKTAKWIIGLNEEV